MTEDRFKVLYKTHKKASLETIEGVFDPHCTAEEALIHGYNLVRNSNEWTCPSLPGLRVIRGGLADDEQQTLLKESLGDYLADPQHLTNLDAHYQLDRPIHLFDTENETASKVMTSKGPALVRDKLRWVTLGGQYNWTKKVYPSFKPGTPGCPEFPESLVKSVSETYGINPQAAIVNYYSEGDILSPHRDVAELSDQDLVSISLGCTCVFYIGLERYDTAPLALLLRSGDIVVMGGKSRFAYHGVGRVFAKTTPQPVCEFAMDDDELHTWISNHRININVRQMQP